MLLTCKAEIIFTSHVSGERVGEIKHIGNGFSEYPLSLPPSSFLLCSTWGLSRKLMKKEVLEAQDLREKAEWREPLSVCVWGEDPQPQAIPEGAARVQCPAACQIIHFKLFPIVPHAIIMPHNFLMFTKIVLYTIFCCLWTFGPWKRVDLSRESRQ